MNPPKPTAGILSLALLAVAFCIGVFSTMAIASGAEEIASFGAIAGIGFDLMSGDWVAPYGHGKSKDIILTTHFDKRSDDDYDYSLTVSFPNQGDTEAVNEP